MRILQALFHRTFNSVIFGITLMVLIALYIAIGSGVVAVREHFEMNELEFFNAWPLKALMTLLVLTLACVTFIRIPLTPPRYGVWCVHIGIITLIFGMSFYYRNKIEGLTRIWTGRTTDVFYDTSERSLFIKINGQIRSMEEMPSLPRFKSYTEGASAINHADLQQKHPQVVSADASTGLSRSTTLSTALGLKDPISVSVVEYHPYANIISDYNASDAGGDTGVRLTTIDMHTNQPVEAWLIGGERKLGQMTLEQAEIEHRPANESALKIYDDARRQLHQLTVRVGGVDQALAVEPGSTYSIKGYELTIENFQPNFPMFGTNENVRALTLLVKTPTQTFRRMVLEGKDVQTDFKLDEPGAPPMGKRQKAPLDTVLSLAYAFNDLYALLPRNAPEKHVLLTTDDGGLIDLKTSFTKPTTWTRLENARGEIQIASEHDHAPGELLADAEHASVITVLVERKEHIRRSDSIIEIPKEKRERNAGATGVYQVLRLRLESGAWKQDVAVPFVQFADEPIEWSGPIIRIPGSSGTIQMTLGHTRRGLPAEITLDRFETVPYPGATGGQAIMRDFKSHLSIKDLTTDVAVQGVAHMNHPVYYPDHFLGRQWLFYQAQWDPEGQRFSVLGVGNRPGVWLMIAGCVMILIGLLYAFYLKPVIIRRMKRKAIEAARARGVMTRETAGV